MASVRQRPLWVTILRSRITFVAAFLLCVVFTMSVYERFTTEREMAARRKEAEAELKLLELRAAELTEKVEYLSADQGVEAELRKHFDVAREGERVVVIVEDEAPMVAGTSTSDDEVPSLWSRLFSW